MPTTAVCDSFLHGRLRVWQPQRGTGYRFTLDPVLLAAFARPCDTVLDLGAGCGIVSLLMLAYGKCKRAIAVEVLPEMAELAERNAHDNGFGAAMQVHCVDLRQFQIATVDQVLFNPPYFKAGHGQPAASGSRDAARHERHGMLADFVACATRHTQTDALWSAIVPQERGNDLLHAAAGRGWQVQRQRNIRSRAEARVRHLLMEAARTEYARPEAATDLLVHGATGSEYSEEVRPWLQGMSAREP